MDLWITARRAGRKKTAGERRKIGSMDYSPPGAGRKKPQAGEETQAWRRKIGSMDYSPQGWEKKKRRRGDKKTQAREEKSRAAEKKAAPGGAAKGWGQSLYH